MMLKVFCIYDSKIEAYIQPFFMRSKGEAIRGFASVCNDPKTQFFIHPEDYTLFELGDFNDINAYFSLHQTPMSIGKAIEFKRPDNNHLLPGLMDGAKAS